MDVFLTGMTDPLDQYSSSCVEVSKVSELQQQ